MKTIGVKSYTKTTSLNQSKAIATEKLRNRMAHKPTSPRDIDDIDFSRISDFERNFINSLDEEDSFDLFESDNINNVAGSYFRPNKNPPQWFTIWISGDLYLVDTEGYDYPRYMARIIMRD